MAASKITAAKAVDQVSCSSTPGTICAWGEGIDGALGTGNTDDSLVPVPGPNLDHVTALGAASAVTNAEHNTAFALRTDGTVWAWGYGGDGLLGDGMTGSSMTPVQVLNLQDIRAIAAGGIAGDVYAVRSDGTVWAWGNGGLGQLGNGQDGPTNRVSLPTQVKNLTDVTAVAVGRYTGYALRSDGTVWAWGYGANGELGDGSGGAGGTYHTVIPVQVSNLTGVRAIAAGMLNAYALKSDGTVWAWGSSNFGALGNGTPTLENWNAPYALTPVQVSNLTNVTAIASNSSTKSAYALRSDGTVWAWGNGYFGELGDGQGGKDSSGVDHFSNVPMPVEALTDVSSIAAGNFTGFAIRGDGTAWAWGANYYGQLGNGTENNGSSPGSTAPVQISNLDNPSAIVAGLAGYALIGTAQPIPTTSLTVSPVSGAPGTTFAATWSCPNGSSTRLGITDEAGNQVTRPTLPVTGNGTDYISSFKASLDLAFGKYTVTAYCSDVSIGFVGIQITRPDHTVLFIQGIGSSSTCNDASSDFLGRVSWLRSALTSSLGTNTKFLYYAYRSPNTASPACSNDPDVPQYNRLDSCWSLDDTYEAVRVDARGRSRLERKPVVGGGQATRLASHLRAYIDSHPNEDISIVTHSQGGVLASYTVKEKLRTAYATHIHAIVTLDSPLRGINSQAGRFLRATSHCQNGDPQLDSSYDMEPGSAVIGHINDRTRHSTRIYTVDADPGYGSGTFRIKLIDERHSQTWWQSAHIQVAAKTHSDIWNGCFVEAAGRLCAQQDGSNIGPVGETLVRFTACGVTDLAADCATYAKQ